MFYIQLKIERYSTTVSELVSVKATEVNPGRKSDRVSMKVRKQPSKKLLPSPKEVEDYVNNCLVADNVQLDVLLGEVCDAHMDATSLQCWSFPKSDMFHWVPLLDKFDDILDKAIYDHWNSESGLQTKPLDSFFTNLLRRILVFSRLLLENCSSRNIYCSYDRLKKLLVTDELDILTAVLELLIIPARKLDSQISLRNTFSRELGTDELVTLAQLSLPFLPEMNELEEAKFALRFREYHISRLSTIPPSDAPKIKYVSLLSTAIFLMSQPDGSVDTAFFSVSPTLVADTSRLIDPSPNRGMKIETAALSVLRACLKNPAKWNEIIHSLDVYAGHGPIVSIYRSMVDAVANGSPLPFPSIFFFSFLDFIGVLCTHVEMEEAFTNSGIILEILRCIENNNPAYLKLIEKSLSILDSLLQQYSSAFDMFFSSNGLQTVMKSLSDIISTVVEAEIPDNQQVSLLQCILRFVDKLIIGGTGDDRLRNLVEGSLFKSMTVLFNHSERFTPECVTHAISLFSIFVHNEPTSLSILLEFGTPHSLLSSVSRSIPLSHDAIAKLPLAFSAICLNSAGSELFHNINPFPSLLSIFLNVEFLKILRGKPTSSQLGTSMDEFLRHHPSFRSMVIESIVAMLKNALAYVEEIRHGPSSTELFKGVELVYEATKDHEKRSEPLLSQILESCCSFVEGVIQTAAHAELFISLGGVDSLINLIYSGGVPFDFTVYNESLSASHLIRILCEQQPEKVISTILIAWVTKATEFNEYLSSRSSTSFFNPILSSQKENLAPQNHIFRHLAASLAVIGLIKDLYVTNAYTYGRNSEALLKAFISSEGQAAVILMSLLLKVCSWEFGLLLHELDEELVAAIVQKAKSEFKTGIFQNFIVALSQLSVGRNLNNLDDEGLREKSSNVCERRTRNTLYVSFVLQRIMNSVSSILSGLSKMISGNYAVTSESLVEKLSETIANGAINSVNWITEDAKDTSLELRSFLVAHIMQVLSVIFIDENGRNYSAMSPVIDAFITLKGYDDLSKAIQSFMVQGLSVGVPSPANFLFALEEILSFFRLLSLKQLSKTKLQEVSCLFSLEFLQLPKEFRAQLPKKVINKTLECLSLLVHTSSTLGDDSRDSPLYRLKDEMRKCFPAVLSDIAEISPQSAPYAASLMKAILSSHGDTPSNDIIEEIYGPLLGGEGLISNSLRFKVLASALNCKQRVTLLPFYIAKLSSIVDVISSSDEAEVISAGFLLLSEVIALSSMLRIEIGSVDIQGLWDFILKTFCSSNDLDICLSAGMLMCSLSRGLAVSVDFTHLTMSLVHKGTLCLNSSDKRYQALVTCSNLVLRHLIETQSQLTSIYEQELLKSKGSRPDFRSKISSMLLTGNLSYCVVRNPDLFKTCFINHFVMILSTENEEYADAEVVSRKLQEKEADFPEPEWLASSQTVDNEAAKSVVDALINALFSETLFASVKSAVENETDEENNEIMASHFRRCHILSLLIELINCYPACHKILSSSPKIRDLLEYLIGKVIFCGELAGMLGSREFVNEPMLVSHFLDSFCEMKFELTENRLVMQEAVVDLVVSVLQSSFKNLIEEYGNSLDNYEKMSKAWCLVMTTYVLLSSREGKRAPGLTHMLVASKMLNAGFVSLLTKIIGEIDAKAPMAPLLASKIVFSLEALVRLGNRASRNARANIFGNNNFIEGSFDDEMLDSDDDMMMDGDGDSEDDDENESGFVDMEVDSDEESEFSSDSEDDMDDGFTDSDDDSEDDFDSDDDDDEMEEDDDSDEEEEFHFTIEPPVAGGPVADAFDSGFHAMGEPAPGISLFDNMDSDVEYEMYDEGEAEEDFSSSSSAGDTVSEENESDNEEEIYPRDITFNLHDHNSRSRPLTGFSSFSREVEVTEHPLISLENEERVNPSSLEVSKPPKTVVTKKTHIWDTNKQIYHSSTIPSNSQRFSQETRLFLQDDTSMIVKVLVDRIATAMVPEANRISEKLSGKGKDASNDAELETPPSLNASAEQTQASPLAAEIPVYEDNGPDADFLIALPFDMRREVLEQYFEERRRNIPVGAEVHINPSFLDSLPGDLRADYERLSAHDVANQTIRQGMFGGLDLDHILNRIQVEFSRADYDDRGDVPASISQQDRNRINTALNSLTSSLRRIESSVPNSFDLEQSSGNQSGFSATVSGRGNSVEPNSIIKVDFNSVMDIGSLATILRTYFNPTMTENRTHIRLLQHLCALPTFHSNLLNMIIYILEEMPETYAALNNVLQTFVLIHQSQSDEKGKSRTPTPKPTPRKRHADIEPFGGSSYVIIQQRALQVLLKLIQDNDKAARFFINKLQNPWKINRIEKRGTDRSLSKTQMSTSYPIVLLLGCLSKPNFFQIPLLVENLLHILGIVSSFMRFAAEGSKPDIPEIFIAGMVKTVVCSELGQKSFNYSVQLFQNLCVIERCAGQILRELADNSINQADVSIREVQKLLDVLKSESKESLNEMLKSLGATSSQVRLNRSMKMLTNTILKPMKPEDRVRSVMLSDNIPKNVILTIGASLFPETLDSPWSNLLAVVDSCLQILGKEQQHYHVANTLLPVIESLFWHSRLSSILKGDNTDTASESILKFADKHRSLLNTMIRGNPALLTSGPFILLTQSPKVLDFDNKRVWFKQQLSRKGMTRPSLSIHVRRSNIFEDSFHSIMGKSGDEVKNAKLSVKFHDEDGLDAGGVTREWFSALSRQMFDPNYALFKVSSVDKITYQPNRMSYVNPDHLLYFTFVGRIIGKAIHDSRLLDCYFTRSFYKHILSIPVDFKDLESVDPEYYKSLSWILENDITDVFELTFSMETDEFGVTKVIDLKPDGSNIAVTEENKKEYVKLVVEYKLWKEVKPQIDAFLRGFNDIIPTSLISIFNEHELELLISGMPDIDVDDWKNNTEYTGYTISSPQIAWFWRLMRSFDQEYRAKFLQFVTGTSKVPLEGFSHLQGSTGIQKFQIHRDYGAKDRLPSAHTCFNQLDLPEYETYEQLKEMMIKAINEGAGFGLV